MFAHRAIQTSYKGYRFRSRQEARWAVFFDALGLAWEYEAEGFDLDCGRYLPDFWLPGVRLWVEVKPTNQDKPEEWERCRQLAVTTSSRVTMVFGEFCPLDVLFDKDYAVVGSNRGWSAAGRFDDGCWEFGECPACHKIGAGLHGDHELCDCKCVRPPKETTTVPIREAPDGGIVGSRTYTLCGVCRRHLERSRWDDHPPELIHSTRKHGDTPRLLAAYKAARSARFEHEDRRRMDAIK